MARVKAGLPTQSWASDWNVRLIMQANRNRDTRPELAIRSAVHRLGLRYRVAARPLATSRLSADLVFPTEKVAVFIDGCFWHGCSLHRQPPASNAVYWAAKIARNRERDTRIDLALADASWTVIRIWEHVPSAQAARTIAEVIGRARREIQSSAWASLGGTANQR